MADGKLIGLLGGLSWVSTLEYYEILNRKAIQQYGKDHSFNCLIRSIEFSDIAANTRIDDTEASGLIVRDAMLMLQDAGVEGLAMCSNTPHMYAEEIRPLLRVPLVHICEATAARVAGQGVKRALVLGTRFTMQRDFYRNALEAVGVEMVVPEGDELMWIHRSVVDEMVRDEFKPETRDGYRALIARMANDGIDGVVYGCTEIPILMKGVEIPIPSFDTMRIHCDAIADFAFDCSS